MAVTQAAGGHGDVERGESGSGVGAFGGREVVICEGCKKPICQDPKHPQCFQALMDRTRAVEGPHTPLLGRKLTSQDMEATCLQRALVCCIVSFIVPVALGILGVSVYMVVLMLKSASG